MAVKPINTGNIYAVLARTNLAARLGLQADKTGETHKPEAAKPEQKQEGLRTAINAEGQVTGRIIDTEA